MRRFACAAAMLFSMAGVCAAANLSVMQMGDSITAGGGRRETATTLAGTYKHTVTTVGTQRDNSLPTAYRPHEGHGGWRIDQLNDNLMGVNAVDAGYNGGYWIKGGNGTGRGPINPTYVTVMAGINDINGFIGNNENSPMSGRSDLIMNTIKGRMTTLAGTLTNNLPNATVLLGGCIPYANGLINDKLTGANATNRNQWALQDGVHPEQELGVNHWVVMFNKWIRTTLVPQLQAQGKKVVYVDQYANFILPNGKVRGWNNQEPFNTNGPDGYADYGLHPNAFGYRLIGETWARSINALTITPVPEPASLGAVAMVGLLLTRRRPRGRAA